MKIKILLSFLISHLFQFVYAQHSILPVPVDYQTTDNEFLLNENVKITVHTKDEAVKRDVESFSGFLMHLGLKTKSESESADAEIVVGLFKSPNSELGIEGYMLNVDKKTVKLEANTSAGIFYGLQTLKQMILPLKDGGNFKIEGCKIKDYPRFAWRGLMFDVSRHFFPVEDVKAFIDKMAEYKFNVFHWHLTDDEGWRIEIKSLPKLTEVGAWRVERFGRFGKTRPYPKEGEKATYGGFYTHEQIKEIVKYAAERNITVVPEIDMPGHSMAALAAYPELSVKKEPKFVNPGANFAEWYGGGKFKMLIENTLNPTDEKVYEFADKVFTEVAQLFPGEYIHMGGDECYHGYWEENIDVQKFMKKNKLKDGHELQAYFVERIGKIIAKKGKKMIGWDEISEGKLDKETAVMSWRGMKYGIEAAKKGHRVVMSPTTFTYLDYTQGDHSIENPIYADLYLEKTYEFEPLPKEVNKDLILGGQGNLWTEVIPDIQFAFYMTYPRAFAIAETLWSPAEKKDWKSFINRTEKHFALFDHAKTNISKAVYDPIIKVYKKDGKLMCELANNVPETVIFYTTDNTYPVKFGRKYNGAFEIPEGNLSLRAQTFRKGKELGRQLQISREELEKRAGR